MNGVQTRLKCKPNVKRCKRFVFAAHSPLLHPNTLKTKAIIHFQTDHILTRFVFPPLYLGEHGWFDKRFMYEESFGMPMVMSWPGHIKPGTQVTGLTQNIDFAPTFLDMCGIEIPEDMQGVSFRRLVEGENTPRNWRKSLYYHYYEFPGFHSVRAHYGVKMERYKLMHFYVDDKWELYDLKEDPAEMHNLYGEKGMEKVAAELKAELARLQEEYDVPESLCK